MEIERILERLAIIGKGLVNGTADENMIMRTRRAYAMIRGGVPAKPAVESIGLPPVQAAELLVFIHENEPAAITKPKNEEMLAFVEACTPSDGELAENRYWQAAVSIQY